jgi:hypothetical protein
MTKRELLEKLKPLKDDAPIKVEVTLYCDADPQTVSVKSFDVMSVSGRTIHVQAPDHEAWGEV